LDNLVSGAYNPAGYNIVRTFVIDNVTYDYNKLPEVCQSLVPKYDDIIMKYNLILLVGVLAFFAMCFWAFTFYKWYKEIKRKKDGS
jgi:hypothetical protein